jgi:hypothetical protein
LPWPGRNGGGAAAAGRPRGTGSTGGPRAAPAARGGIRCYRTDSERSPGTLPELPGTWARNVSPAGSCVKKCYSPPLESTPRLARFAIGLDRREGPPRACAEGARP